MPSSGIDAITQTGRSSFGSRASHWWWNLCLFLLTFFSSTAFGVTVTRCFQERRAIDLDYLFAGYVALYHLDPSFWYGLSFSVPLLIILLAHEFGHYVACRRIGVEASLPYFLPSPFLLGTLGAFIRIKSPIYSRKQLFDIGISGPVAGFVVLLPFLFAGSAWSRPVAITGHGDTVSLGLPLAMRLAEWVTTGHISELVALHPFAVAAWAGLLATAMNLIPMGQLDGGHILYAAAGERWHRVVSLLFLVVLIGLGFIYRAWWFWAAVMFLAGRRHPLVYDIAPIEKGRGALALGACLLFLLSIAIVPVALR
jgi:membrane-associated protease RseP (regulator of RpoE activity)